ncbi:MAG: adenylate kinase [Micrococcaceae bacterium]
MNRLLIVGPPGSGKGTQAERIAEHYNIVAISTGDIFRQNIKDETPLGLTAKKYTDAGNYVPDEVTNNMVRDRLSQADVKDGFLLDGYPRTLAQVKELDSILDENNQKLNGVIELTVDEDELVTRLLKRAQESARSDDTEDVIRHRQEVYREQTAPLIAVYEKRGIVKTVDGVGDLDTISESIFAAIDELQNN